MVKKYFKKRKLGKRRFGKRRIIKKRWGKRKGFKRRNNFHNKVKRSLYKLSESKVTEIHNSAISTATSYNDMTSSTGL